MDTMDPNNWFWRPGELLLAGAFKWNGFWPFVGDSADLLNFLRGCLLDQGMGLVRDESIEQIMFALGGVPEGEISAGLAKVGFSEPLFFKGLYTTLQDRYNVHRGTSCCTRIRLVHLCPRIASRFGTPLSGTGIVSDIAGTPRFTLLAEINTRRMLGYPQTLRWK